MLGIFVWVAIEGQCVRDREREREREREKYIDRVYVRVCECLCV